ncbi:hypothetical protein Tco_0306157, partial [Tanacetum coccineum]
KIIISAYVVFDEKKGWKWKAENSNQEGRELGTFTVLWDGKNGEAEQIWNNDSTVHDATVHATVYANPGTTFNPQQSVTNEVSRLPT